MPSTYSPNLRIELIGQGEQANTWGVTTNNNLGTLIGQAIAGLVDVDVTSGDVTLTQLNGVDDQARNMIINVTGTPSVARTVKCPDGDTKVYVVVNSTGQSVDFTTVSGAGVTIAAGLSVFVYCDGVDVVNPITSVDFLEVLSDLIVDGNVGVGTTTPGAKLDVVGGVKLGSSSAAVQVDMYSATNWNYSNLNLRRNASNTSTPRFLGFLLDGDANNNTTIGGYPAIWGIYSGTPTTGSTSSGLSAKMGLASYAGFNFYTNGTQAMTLDASGNLGIGTSSPAFKLDVGGQDGTNIALRSTGTTATKLRAYVNGSESGVIGFLNGGGQYFETAGTERMRLDSSGNLGLGVTPSAWNNTVRALQVGVAASLTSPSTGAANAQLRCNEYVDASGFNKYLTSDYASRYRQISGQHIWENAPSGTAGNTFTYTQAMTLDASGNLGLGVTPGTKLDIGSGTLRIKNAAGDTSGLLIYQDTGDSSTFKNYYTGPFKWIQGSTQAMTLDASGNLGIGTSSPAFSLDISQAAPRIRQTATTGTNSVLMQLVNTGGTAYVGLDSSTGGVGGAYSLNLYHSGAYPIVFSTSGAEKMRLDASGNLGLGVTPNGWASSYRAFQIGTSASLSSVGAYTLLGQNFYNDGSLKYISTGAASYYQQVSGVHSWYTAPSGTAGNAITFTQAMTLDASGNLNVANLTASRALVSDGSKNLASSATTATELGYVSGVTSSIQTQLNGKAPTTSGTSILYGNGSGGFSNVSIGTGLSFSAGTLSSTVTGPIPSGTRMVFAQASAPSGWTQVTTYNNYAMRVVSGTGAGTGGSVGFTTAFASQTPAGSVAVSGGAVGNHTLTVAEMPSHTHTINGGNLVSGINLSVQAGPTYQTISSLTTPTASDTGGDGAHNHPFTNPTATFTGSAINLAVQYLDVIICSKD